MLADFSKFFHLYRLSGKITINANKDHRYHRRHFLRSVKESCYRPQLLQRETEKQHQQ